MSGSSVVRNGRVVVEAGVVERDIVISADGRIERLVASGDGVGDQMVDARGCYVLPGGIDTHTHIRWPFDGRLTADSFETATGAAAAAGTTTVIDFVPPQPHGSLVAAAERRLREAEGRSFIDYAFHPILTSSSRERRAEIPRLIEMGLASFKMYTTYEQRVDDGGVWLLMRAIAESGGLPGFHAENHELITRLTAELVADGRVTMADFPQSRPPIVEAEAVAMVLRFARDLAAPVYLFHVSAASAVAELEHAQADGMLAFGETCTHYLTLTDDVFSGPDAWRYLITPPIRAVGNQDALWRALRRGVISAVGSDHCAYRSADKTAAAAFTEIPAGAPGLEARIPLLWSLGVGRGRLQPEEFALAISTHPAQALGLYPRKGTIAAGGDADLLIIDPDARWTFAHEPSCTDYGLYDGWELEGRVRMTLVRGRTVARDGKPVGAPGHGRFVPRRIDEGTMKRALDSGGSATA